MNSKSKLLVGLSKTKKQKNKKISKHSETKKKEPKGLVNKKRFFGKQRKGRKNGKGKGKYLMNWQSFHFNMPSLTFLIQSSSNLTIIKFVNLLVEFC